MNSRLSPRSDARLPHSRPATARRRARWGVHSLALAVWASLALPSVASALEADPTPRWWGTFHDELQSDWGGHYVPVAGDFNGDGYGDIARIHGIGGETVIDVFAGAGQRFDASRWGDSGLGGYWPGQHYIAGDVNGDGKDDIIRVFDEYGEVSVDVLIKGEGTSFTYARWATKQGPYTAGASYVAGDFDGDGKADVAKVSLEEDNHIVAVDVYATTKSYVPSRWITSSVWLLTPTPSLTAVADLDGDGLDDVIVPSPLYTMGVTFKSDGATFSEWSWDLMPPNLLDLLDPQYFQPNMYGMVDAHVGDVDGDTKPDIVYSGVGKVDTEVAFNVGFGAAHHDEYIAADLPADHVVLGDWDGDGLAEPASLRYTGDSVVAYTFNTPARFDYEAEPVRWGRAQGTFDPEQRYLSGDFNGDDQPDVARVFADGWETSIDTHLNNGAGFSMVRGITRAGAHAAGQHFLAGDFNGDEFDDVLKVWAFNGATVFDAYYGGGAGLTAAYSVGGGGGDWGAMDYVAGDFDGDGLTDVAKLWNHDGKLIADVYRSNGPGFEDFEYWLPDSQVPYYEGAKYTVGDYNGDHRDDIARIFRDTDVNEGPIYAGAVSFGEAGSKDVVIDYFSVDVLASDGDEFAASRWVSKSALFSPDSHVVSAHMDSDELEDIVILAPTPEGTIGMVLFVSNATYFDPSLLRKDEDIGYAKDMMKVVAADFDLDGRAEIATMTRDKSSVETNFDVWGGETAPDPSLLGAAGDTSTYTKEQAIAVLASQGYTLGNGAELQDKDCTIIYPNAAEERQARDLGLLVCARDLNGAKRIYSATVYGGCDWSSGVGTCSIGRASPTVNVLGKSITITGPSAAACASITQEMVCGEVRGRFTSAAFSLSPDNVYLSGGVYVGPYAGATASFKNSVLSGSVKIDGVATLKYSLDANDVVDVGAVGFSRLYGEVKKLSPVTDAINQGLNACFGALSDAGSGFVNGVKKVWSKLGL